MRDRDIVVKIGILGHVALVLQRQDPEANWKEIYLKAVEDVARLALDKGIITWEEIGEIDRIGAVLLEEICDEYSIYTIDEVHSMMVALFYDLREAVDPPLPLASTNGVSHE